MKNMVEVYRYMDNGKEASFWCDKLGKWYDEVGEHILASQAFRRAKRIRDGEPLNRIVVCIHELLLCISNCELPVSAKPTSVQQFETQRSSSIVQILEASSMNWMRLHPMR